MSCYFWTSWEKGKGTKVQLLVIYLCLPVPSNWLLEHTGIIYYPWSTIVSHIPAILSPFTFIILFVTAYVCYREGEASFESLSIFPLKQYSNNFLFVNSSRIFRTIKSHPHQPLGGMVELLTAFIRQILRTFENLNPVITAIKTNTKPDARLWIDVLPQHAITSEVSFKWLQKWQLMKTDAALH